MNYTQVKKLDEDTQKNLQEGEGPVDECLCNLLAPPDEPKGLRGSIRKVIASIGGRRSAPGGAARGAGARGAAARGGGAVISGGPNSVMIPLTFEKGGRGVFTTKEEVKRTTSCGKCGCDKEKFVLKHSYANIRITSPDVSSICPCESSTCMPGKDKLNNNITVTVEHMVLSDNDAEEYDTHTHEIEHWTSSEKPKPVLDRTSAKDLVDHVWNDWKSRNEWRNDIEEEGSEDAKTLDSRPDETFNDALGNSQSYEGTEEHEKMDFNKPNFEI